MPQLTRAQRRIIGEIDEISEELGNDHRPLVEEWEGHPFLTTILELARRQLISTAIVHEHTFFDEMLGTIIARYFFGASGGTKAWRTKKFQRFNYFILERLYLQQKVALVRDLRPLPKGAVTYIDKLNDLRNAVAHAFFPENLRGERTLYQGRDIFTIEGFRTFREDREPVVEILMHRAYGT